MVAQQSEFVPQRPQARKWLTFSLKVKLISVLYMDYAVPLFKIADFGISCAVTGTQGMETYQGRGTEEYKAPEVRKHQYSLPADIWSLGCMMLFFTVGVKEMSAWTANVREEITKWYKVHPSTEPLPKDNEETLESLRPSLEGTAYECFQEIVAEAVDLSPTTRLNIKELREMLEKAREAQSFKENMREFRTCKSIIEKVPPSPGSEKRASTSTPSLANVPNFLRHCLKDDYVKGGYYLHHKDGTAVLFDSSDQINSLFDGWTALGYAAYNNHIEIAETLLEAGADVNAPQAGDATALHDACDQGQTKAVKLLLEQQWKADVDARNIARETPLHVAVRKSTSEKMTNYTQVVELLLDNKAKADAKNQNGEIPLHIAVTKSNGEEMVRKLLLRTNADVVKRGTDVNGFTILHKAVSDGNVKILDLILRQRPDVNARDSFGWTPLQTAVSRESIEMTDRLLTAGADVTIRYQSGWTVLHSAAAGGNAELVKRLLQTTVDINARDAYDCTPLSTAATSNPHARVVKLLLESNADFSIPDVYGDTALHRASRSGNLEIVELLLDKIHDPTFVSRQNKKKWSSLELAIKGDVSGNLVERLVKAGADLNQPIEEFATCLQLASKIGRCEVIDVLLKEGANVNLNGGWYGSALQVAARYGNAEVVKILLAHGAIDIEGGWFGSAVNAASSHEHIEIVQLLQTQSRHPEPDHDLELEELEAGKGTFGPDIFVPNYLKDSLYGDSFTKYLQGNANEEGGVMTMPLKLPSMLSSSNSSGLLTLHDDGLQIEYCAADSGDVGAIRSNNPIPPSTQIYYFEVKVLNQGDNGYSSAFEDLLIEGKLALA